MKRVISLLLCLVTVALGVTPAFAYSVPDGEDVAYEAAAESMVLLRNEKNALPLTSKDKVALFGEGQVYTDGMTGGFFLMGRGSGDFLPTKTPPSPCDLLASYANKGKLGGVYSQLSAKYKSAATKASGTDFVYSPSEADIKAAAEYADKAIYFLNRTTYEGLDNEKLSYYLTMSEKEDLKKICAAFAPKPVIVVLNMGSVMSCGFALGRVNGIYADAVLSASYPGISGVEALCDILVGDVNPSGKTADTYAKDLDDYPSYKSFYESSAYSNYTEDIYVGYRYFETFKKEDVDYPFGYGLSYTDFSTSIKKYEETGGKIKVEVTVKNTGDRSGKEVVQIYFSAPQKGEGSARISKAARELCAYSKTKLLSPGESQTLTLEFSVDSMASYDDTGLTGNKSAYVLEQGEYKIYVGTSVRDCTLAGTHTESTLRVTEQLSELCEPSTAFNRMTYDGTERIGGKATERKDILHVSTTAEKTNPSSPIQYADFLSGKATLAEFLSQMTDEELCTFAVMTHATSSITGAWGGSAEVAEKYGIPTTDTCDGPAGFRMVSKGTGLPCATALACTWNPEVVRALGDVIGREAILSEVDTWLAPAVNIHRFPLCGRNFEYYSEDPLVSGLSASALISGVEKYGVACSVKHFVGNERELNRMTMSSNMSERALREIYLKPFKMCVEGGVSSVMTSYNKLNGIETAENAELIRGILRGEWGFDGLITTDWSNDSVVSREVIAGNNVKSSLEINMLRIDPLISGLKNGTVTRSLLIENATYVMKFLAERPDGTRMAEYEPKKISADRESTFEAEDYYHKHGFARPEISTNATFLSYLRSYATSWEPYVTYRLNVEQEGWYIVSLNGANVPTAFVSDSLRVFVNGEEFACAYNGEGTGNWFVSTKRELTKVYLPAGEVSFKVKCATDRACGNFDKFSFTPVEKAYKPISTAEDLINLMSRPYDWKYKYYLTADIDLSGYDAQSPIGKFGSQFTGVFDGMGYSIKGVNISSSSEKELGLFGSVKGGIIRDLSVYGKVESTCQGAIVGGVVGKLDPGASIVGCKNYADVTYTSDTAPKGVGGVAGYVYADTTLTGSIIKNSENNVSVTSSTGGEDAFVGGIAGRCRNSGKGAIEIRSCINRGAVSGGGEGTGGILGYVDQTATGGGVFVFDCDNRGSVSSGVGKTGGIAGYLTTLSTVDNQKVTLTGCINRAEVTGADGAPTRTLLIGENNGAILVDCTEKEPLEEDLPNADDGADLEAPVTEVPGSDEKSPVLVPYYVLILCVVGIFTVCGIAVVIVLRMPSGKEKSPEKNNESKKEE